MISIYFQQHFSFEMCFYKVSVAGVTNEGCAAPRFGFLLLRAGLEPVWGLGALLTSASSERELQGSALGW